MPELEPTPKTSILYLALGRAEALNQRVRGEGNDQPSRDDHQRNADNELGRGELAQSERHDHEGCNRGDHSTARPGESQGDEADRQISATYPAQRGPSIDQAEIPGHR